jgi:hypothetical protein
MGLDMMINKIRKTDHTIDQLEELDNSELLMGENVDIEHESFKDFYPLSKYKYINAASIFHEVGYWRKFNALHGYIVENFQGGVDECQMTELFKEDVEKILNTLKTVQETKDHSLLEPVGGFFFGSTDIDDYYWHNVESGISQLTKILNETDWDNERIFYQASW